MEKRWRITERKQVETQNGENPDENCAIFMITWSEISKYCTTQAVDDGDSEDIFKKKAIRAQNWTVFKRL